MHNPGKRIRRLREARGLSLTELAEISGVNRKDIWRIETGRTENPGIFTVLAITAAMELPVMAVLEGDALLPGLRGQLILKYGDDDTDELISEQEPGDEPDEE